MPWLVLVVSGLLEAVWATALGQSAGFTRQGWTALFIVTELLSVAGLGWAMKKIPVGTAYAVWTGIGAVVTVAVAAALGTESLTFVKVLFLAGIIGCVIGLKVMTSREV